MYFIQVFVYSIFTQIYKHIQPCFPLKTTLTLFISFIFHYIYAGFMIKWTSKSYPYYVYIQPNPLLSEGRHTHFLLMCESDHTQVCEWRKPHAFDHVWSWPHSGKWVKEGTYILIMCEASHIQVLCIKNPTPATLYHHFQHNQLVSISRKIPIPFSYQSHFYTLRMLSS